MVIRADSAPIQVINQSGGQVILSDNADPSTGVTINGDLKASSVQVVGNVTASNDSRVAIHESGTGSYLKANKITASDSWVYLVLTGDAAYTSQTGGQKSRWTEREAVSSFRSRIRRRASRISA